MNGMPNGIRKAMIYAVVVLAIVAAVGNWGHVFDFAHAPTQGGQGEGQSVVAAFLPDILLILCVVKLRYDPTSLWAWSGLTASVTAVGWASVAMAHHTFTARAVALWPVLVAVIAAGLMETKGHAEVAAEATATPPKRAPRKAPEAHAPEATRHALPVVSPQVTGGGTVREQIVAALEGGPLTRAQLVASVGAADGTVKKELTNLKATGRVEQDPSRAHHWRTHVALKSVAR